MRSERILGLRLLLGSLENLYTFTCQGYLILHLEEGELFGYDRR
jgi:hypothetical protein